MSEQYEIIARRPCYLCRSDSCPGAFKEAIIKGMRTSWSDGICEARHLRPTYDPDMLKKYEIGPKLLKHIEEIKKFRAKKDSDDREA